MGTALLLSGSGLLSTTLGIRLAQGGQSLGLAGVVVSCFAVGLVLGSWRAVRLIQRVGHIRAFAGFAAILGVTTLLMTLGTSAPFWMLLRLAQGFVLGGSYLVIESWLGASTAASARARVLGVYTMTCQVALALGQLLITLRSSTLVIAAMLFIVALVPVAWTRQSQPMMEEASRIGFREMARRAPVAALGCLVAGCTVGSLLHLGAAYATALGADVDHVAAFIASAVIGGLVLQWPVGLAADRVDRRLIIELIALATAAGAFALFVTGRALTGSSGTLAFTLSAFGLGAACFVLYPVSVAHAQDRVMPSQTVAASATMVLAYGVGSAVGPLFLSLTLEAFGPHALPVGLVLFNVLLGLLAFLRLARHLRARDVWHSPFRPVSLPQVAPHAELESAPSSAARRARVER